MPGPGIFLKSGMPLISGVSGGVCLSQLDLPVCTIVQRTCAEKATCACDLISIAGELESWRAGELESWRAVLLLYSTWQSKSAVFQHCLRTFLLCLSTFCVSFNTCCAHSYCIPALPHAEKNPNGPDYACIFMCFIQCVHSIHHF